MTRGKKSRVRPSRQKQLQTNNRNNKPRTSLSSPSLIVDRSVHISSEPAFSLRDAAKFHQRDSHFQFDANLRHRSITFVTSEDATLAALEGTFKPTKPTSPPPQPSARTPPFASRPQSEAADYTSTAVQMNMLELTSRRNSISSCSSEEVLLFSGRNQVPKEHSVVVHRSAEAEIAPQILVEPDETPSIRSLTAAPTPKLTNASHILPQDEMKSLIPEDSLSKKLRRRQRQKNKGTTKSGEEYDADFISFDCMSSPARSDDMLADYIENMRESGALEDIVGAMEDRDVVLRGEAPHSLRLEEISASRSARNPSKLAFSGWNPSDVEDFDDLSTSDEIHEVINAILSKRERSSGIQYLVVWEGANVDDARWIHQAALTMPGAKEKLDGFEATIKAANDESGDWTDDSESDDGDDVASNQDGGSEVDSDEEDYDWHERDLEARRVSRMTDERIARLLSKQEELGLGSDDLVLFDGMAIDDSLSEMNEDEEEEIIPLKPARKKYITPRSAKAAKRKARHAALFAMQSDELFGDGYGEFDVMDHDRPSLMRERIEKPGFEADVMASLQAQWENNRSKKGLRKRQREELRAQGLLGKRKPDLKLKYKEGMSMGEVKHEIENFLLSDEQQSCALPPLDKKDRKIVHEIAHAFNLKSKSAGSGKSRFPVLYKTSRTATFSEATFQNVHAQLEKRFFSRMDRGGNASRKVGASGGGGAADVGYRHGDVVGASAPELGAENKGRAMLEKMGWSSGTALGALNNKGILLPVAHVVRKTRAGLG